MDHLLSRSFEKEHPSRRACKINAVPTTSWLSNKKTAFSADFFDEKSERMDGGVGRNDKKDKMDKTQVVVLSLPTPSRLVGD